MCLHNEIKPCDIMLGLPYMGPERVRSVSVRECEDGLQMAACWRFTAEQWLSNASVWDVEEMCDLSAAVSIQQVCIGWFLPEPAPRTPLGDTGSKERITAGNY